MGFLEISYIISVGSLGIYYIIDSRKCFKGLATLQNQGG